MSLLKAITFDLWDTLVIDDSDEPLREAAGLRNKKEQRRYLLWEALHDQSPIDLSVVQTAYDVADAAFFRVWHGQFVTWTIGERIDVILRGLGRTLPEDVLANVVQEHEQMEIDIPPRLIEGCSEALAELAQRYKLAVVSDTIVTPGRGLRQVLNKHGVQHFFGGFAFSDEVGRCKPHPKMFESAADQLGVEVGEMLHIGDRDHNDIRGAQAMGMKAILFTASRDVDKNRTRADAICDGYAELPAVVERLAAG